MICPNCGYCPHCGRGGHCYGHGAMPPPWAPVRPRPWLAVDPRFDASAAVHKARAALS